MVVIIGAGLSGLLTAYRLKKEGIPFKVLEARPRTGGRINTVLGTSNTPVEMGATWFNPQHKNLRALLEELELEYFEQYMNGSVFFQRAPTSSPEIIEIPNQSPSYRIAGGTSKLINTLYNSLDKNDVLLNQQVTRITFKNKTFEVVANETFEANQLVLALPPKLWAKKIIFDPLLPNDLMNIATQTHTWMEDSIKIALTYKEPFWEQNKLPSSFFSNSGPITEFYDHCDYTRSKFALCGFISNTLKNLNGEERKVAVLDQLQKAFGPKVSTFTEYEECIWSNENFTFEPLEDFVYPHQNNGNPVFSKSYFTDKLLVSSSESALEFPGYMDGAVFAGNKTAAKIIHSVLEL